MVSIPSLGVTSRRCASTSPDTSRSLRSSAANCSPPTTCWMCADAASSGIQSFNVDWGGLEPATVVRLRALAMGCVRGSGLAGRDFARLARPTILARLGPQRDDVDVARWGRVEVNECAAHEVGARASDEFAVRRLDHRRRGIDRSRRRAERECPFSKQPRDEAVAQGYTPSRPSADPPRRRLSRMGAGAWFSIHAAPLLSASNGSWSARPTATAFNRFTRPAGIGNGARSMRFLPPPFFELGIMRRGPSG